MFIFVRLRRLLARRPLIAWTIAVAGAVVVASSVHGAAASIDDARARWGRSVDAWVATDDIAAGDPVDGRLERRSVPAAMLPDDAMAGKNAPAADSVARQQLGGGEIVTDHDITSADGNDSLAPAGWVVVAVEEPISTGAPIGGRASISADGTTLAADAIIVGRQDDAVLVAVPADDGAAVAAAATASNAALLLKP